MLIDFNKHPEISLNCDICVVGGGAAGAVLFDTLSKTNLKILLLESGGLDPHIKTQELNEGFTRLNGKRPNEELTDLVWLRLRSLGGTTGHWGGGVELFDELDFLPRNWIKDSGWPIKISDLEPYYEEAKRYVEINSNVFDERVWLSLGIPPPYKFNFKEITTQFSLKSGFLNDSGYLNYPGPVNFKKYLVSSAAQKSNNVVLYNATVTNLKSGWDGSVQYCEVVSSELRKRKVRAKIYVLAAGGWENPRIMLNANSGAGIGNESDCVGRYYLAHPHGIPADIICPSKDVATELAWKFQFYKIGNNRAFPYLAWKESTQRQHQLLSSSISLRPNYDKESAVFKAMQIRDRFSHGEMSYADIKISDVALLLSEIDDVFLNSYRKLFNRGVRTRMMETIGLDYIQESTPKRSSRIYLSNEKDRLGVKKIVVDWHIDAQEVENIYKVFKLFAATARDLGWGRVQFRKEADIDSGNPTRGLKDAAHPSGATRMSLTSKNGVVDQNLRVHTTKNLYVCGSSVFPTNGWVSPTFTIVALASRLAKHIKTNFI